MDDFCGAKGTAINARIYLVASQCVGITGQWWSVAHQHFQVSLCANCDSVAIKSSKVSSPRLQHLPLGDHAPLLIIRTSRVVDRKSASSSRTYISAFRADLAISFREDHEFSEAAQQCRSLLHSIAKPIPSLRCRQRNSISDRPMKMANK